MIFFLLLDKQIEDGISTVLIQLIFAGIFAIIGLATPNWHEVEQSTSVSSVPKVIEHHGIWARCSLTPLDSFDCGAHSEEKGRS